MNAMKYHVVSAKHFGYDKGYDYLFFPINKFSKEEALDQFQPVEKFTEKNNNIYPYTAYEYDGNTYYSVQYSGIADESEIK